MKERESLPVDVWVYLVAFALALFIRFVGLGRLPLGNVEASWALQAFSLIHPNVAHLGAQPAYTLFTSAMFFLFGTSETVARLLPAMVGALIVFVPVLFRHQIGREAAWFAALGLAFEPGLVAASRTAGSPIISAVFLALALGFILNRKPAWAGICAGLAMLGGAQFLPTTISVLLLVGWEALAKRKVAAIPGVEGPLPVNFWNQMGMWLAGTLLVAGTLFFTTPSGLSAFAASIAAYFLGWKDPQSVSIGHMLVVLVISSPLALLFGIWGAVRSIFGRDALDGFFARLWLISLVLVVVYPGRQPQDLIWTLIPLWGLAGRQIGRLIPLNRTEALPALLQMILMVVLLFFGLMNLAAITLPDQASETMLLRLAALIGALVLMGLLAALVAWGWSPVSAGRGLIGGVAVFLLVLTLANTWRAAGLGTHPEAELWRVDALPGEADLLQNTLTDLSKWKTGQANSLDVFVAGDAPASLRWMLRGYSQVEFGTEVPTDATPAIVFTSDQITLALNKPYRGQDFVLEINPVFANLDVRGDLLYLIYRVVPLQKSATILWARADIFPGQVPDVGVKNP